MQAGDKVSARALLSEVADASAKSGNRPAEVEARLRLGLLGAEAGEHAESARQFQLAAGVARHVGDNAKVIVALRNAADELRLQHDLADAERLLNQAFAIKLTPPLETDIAIAKVVLAVLRHDQDRPDEVNRLLNEAAETFRRKLEVLEHGENAAFRERLKAHLREVKLLRRTLSN